MNFFVLIFFLVNIFVLNLFFCKLYLNFLVTQFSGEEESKVQSQSLEALLLGQNRQLQGENSSLRKETIDLNSELKNIQSRENTLKNQVQNQEALIEKLEKDLLSGQSVLLIFVLPFSGF